MFNEHLNEKQIEIKRWVSRLDDFAVDMEARWGIGNLFEYASADLMEKFNRQMEKLHDAINKQDLKLVAELIEGSIRGWKALEKSALENGYKPQEHDHWDVKLESGFHLRISKTTNQARTMTEKGVYVWSLKEIARVLEKDYTIINQLKETMPELHVEEVKQKIDWDIGDEIPF